MATSFQCYSADVVTKLECWAKEFVGQKMFGKKLLSVIYISH